jgi:protein-ribulosamine 3-kinase
LIEQLLESVFEGEHVHSHMPLSGGDINEVYLVKTSHFSHVIKLNSGNDASRMFKLEKTSLKLMRDHSEFIVPKTTKLGSHLSTSYIVLEYIEKGKGRYPQKLSGRCLAKMHLKSEVQFGFPESNYIGSLVQTNDWASNWNDFFINMRILPLLEQTHNHFSKSEKGKFEQMFKNLGNFFPPAEPSLLHGDLWSGNTFSNTRNRPVVYDPAVYYGHHLMDLGMSRLFGGFDTSFYEAYQEIRPLENNWEESLDIANLYPLLVHLKLFGASYKGRITTVLSTYF